MGLTVMGYVLDLISLVHIPAAGSSAYDNQTSGCLKSRKFCEKLSECQLLNTESTPRTYSYVLISEIRRNDNNFLVIIVIIRRITISLTRVV
jgi:hypothetical protein